jgi:eukaryotic-like serine/threonine-protein kinase
MSDADPDVSPDDALDAALGAAFGAADESTLRPPSTDDEDDTRFPSADAESAASDAAAEHEDFGGATRRYEILGEIARGGFGVVVRALDRDLGREVALKILRPELRDRAVHRRRFLREARLTGGLEHPGIPPIHDVGRLGPRTPFFAMKLVRGRTLAAALQARADPSVGLPAFVAAFQKLCDALAFAHARGVVHRDLKPANIMLGDFGEVQVMDWGVAKDLAHAADDAGSAAPTRDPSEGATSPGTVMGTLSYMAPEQTRGVADPRTDVFALGLVLVEILTGERAYAFEDAEDLLRGVRAAELGPAFARLEAAAVDPGLASLARSFLAADPARRPPDAGAAAAALAAHLALAAERTRRAELEAARERTKAAAERRARRRTVVFGTTLAGAAALMVGSWIYVVAARAAKENETSKLHREAAARVEALVGRAEAAGDGAATAWEAALAAAREAEAVVRAGESDDALRTAAAERTAQVRTRALAERAAVESRARNARLAERLDNLRAAHLVASEADVEFPPAMKEAGLDFKTATDDELARVIRDSPVRDALQDAVDAWWSCRDAGKTPNPTRERLQRVSLRLADDPAQAELLRLFAREDVAGLAAFAQATDPENCSQRMARMIMRCLVMVGRAGDATNFAARAWPLHGGDFWFNLAASHAASIAGRPEAVRYASVAAGLRPSFGAAWSNLSVTLEEAGRTEEALAAAKRGVVAEPNRAELQHNLGATLFEANDLARAFKAFDEAVRLNPRLAVAYEGRAAVHGVNGDWVASAADLTAALAADSRPAERWFSLGNALRKGGDRIAAREAYRVAAERDPTHVAALVNWGGSLVHEGRRREALEPFRRAAALPLAEAQPLLAYGDVLIDLGETDEALAVLDRAQREHPTDPQVKWMAAKARLLRAEAATALALAREAEALAEESGDVRYVLAWALDLSGAFAAAADEAAEAVALGVRAAATRVDATDRAQVAKRRAAHATRSVAELTASKIAPDATADETRDVAAVLAAKGATAEAERRFAAAAAVGGTVGDWAEAAACALRTSDADATARARSYAARAVAAAAALEEGTPARAAADAARRRASFRVDLAPLKDAWK